MADVHSLGTAPRKLAQNVRSASTLLLRSNLMRRVDFAARLRSSQARIVDSFKPSISATVLTESNRGIFHLWALWCTTEREKVSGVAEASWW